MPNRFPSLLTGWILACFAVLATAHETDVVKPAFPSEVTITVEGTTRVIRANGIPNHPTGQFPGKGNPNTIAPQHYDFHVPAEPKVADATTPLRMQPFGVAVNGVVFDPGAAEWWHGERAWQYEPLSLAPLYLGIDASRAHVQPNGAYHYHGIPTALIQVLTDGRKKMVVVGWAADGFPIYNPLGHMNPKDAAGPLKSLKSSYRIKAGQRPGGPGGKYDGSFVADFEYVAGLGDLDECNGVFGVTPEYPNGIYHYVLTEQFPFIPRLFRGTPDPSFNRGPVGRPGPGGRPGFHLIPPFAEPQLNLSADQRQQITALENETKAKLGKILTADQLKTLQETRPPGPPGRGPSGPESSGPGRPEGHGDGGLGDPPPDAGPQSEAVFQTFHA
ncbi:MAG TPA: YHYH protein [Tepidisphaeraceae bacterium]|jgi:hypothetical protein|nr:YHYH protein [Tepidisphaeraceae bacterium]